MNAAPEFGKVVIFGIGLIGGSFALALKAAGQAGEIVGFGRTATSLTKALELGVIDRIGIHFGQDIPCADLIFIATPVGQMRDVLMNIEPHLNPETVVMDAGSVKEEVVSIAYQCLGKKIGQFVPVHPVAGAENSGALAARVSLFKERKVVLTPLPENSALTVARVCSAWERCGANVSTLEPHEHDRVFAAVSHLPHLLSYALVHYLTVRENSDLYFDYAASGFRDFTRIAASHPEMWRDISLSNQAALLEELNGYQRQLDELSEALRQKDATSLEKIFTIARSARRAWAKDGKTIKM